MSLLLFAANDGEEVVCNRPSEVENSTLPNICPKNLREWLSAVSSSAMTGIRLFDLVCEVSLWMERGTYNEKNGNVADVGAIA